MNTQPPNGQPYDELAPLPSAKGIGGRKRLPDSEKRKRRVLWLTDSEWEKVERFASSIKAGGNKK